MNEKVRSLPKIKEDRIKPIFKSLLPAGSEVLPWVYFCQYLLELGLDINKDPRLKPVLDAWLGEGRPKDLDIMIFSKLAHLLFSLLEKASKGQLIIPQFEQFSDELYTLYFNTKSINDGKVADYIPQLGRVSSEKYGISICTVDGQRQSFGDSNEMFCVQSACKPISYCLALKELGEEKVHQHVGREPSGHSFNEISLNKLGLPHNPMINSGAIMTSSMIKPHLSRADRFEYIIDVWSKLMGGERPNFSNPIYLSERETADRNFALGYFMRENNAFPEGTDLVDTLEFYFQCCSLEVTTQMMSVLAATLANGGVCPFTEERVFDHDAVQRCLSLMYSCGMYDFSGEWAFSVGLPAKSGVSGVTMVIVPNIMGVCIWSPLLDENGNSVRGIEFCKQLIEKYNFHNFDHILHESGHKKIDPRSMRNTENIDNNASLLWACSANKISEIKYLIAKGVNLAKADYDGRTGLHLAASEGNLDVVKLLHSMGVELMPKDRWGLTPLDDAKRENRKAVIDWFENR